MSNYQTILVVIDPNHKEQPALKRAVFFAQKYASKIILTSCIYDRSYEMINVIASQEREQFKQLLIKQQLESLQEYAKNELGHFSTECKVVWRKRVYEGILEVAKSMSCDLIMKATKKHNKLGHKLFTPTDWHLLRKSPINVLMIKNHEWIENGNMVCSLSVASGDKVHESLSDLVTQYASQLADTLSANLHLVNAFSGAPPHIGIEVPQFSAEKYNLSILARHEKGLNELAVKYGLSLDNVHVLEGLPEDIVSKLCRNLDAELLVLGSVGRRGLSAALLGNTAEQIIDKLNCDTLVIKPQ